MSLVEAIKRAMAAEALVRRTYFHMNACLRAHLHAQARMCEQAAAQMARADQAEARADQLQDRVEQMAATSVARNAALQRCQALVLELQGPAELRHMLRAMLVHAPARAYIDVRIDTHTHPHPHGFSPAPGSVRRWRARWRFHGVSPATNMDEREDTAPP